MAKKNNKVVATLQDIDNLVREYYLYSPGETPKDIEFRRNIIHSEMSSKYSNPEDIWRAIWNNKGKWHTEQFWFPEDDNYDWRTYESSVFPGYELKTDPKTGNQSYEASYDHSVPKGYRPMDGWEYDLSDEQNFIAPDFINHFVFYHNTNRPYPTKRTPAELLDLYLEGDVPEDYITDADPRTMIRNRLGYTDEQLSDVIREFGRTNDWNEAIKSALENWKANAWVSKYFDDAEKLAPIYEKNKDWLTELYKYAKDHNGNFNYMDFRIADLMDELRKYSITPETLYEYLQSKPLSE